MKQYEIKLLIDRWVHDGVISPEQALRMSDSLTDYSSEQSSNKFISAVMYVGAMALSLGALLFIASNWEHFTKSIKLVFAFLLPVLPLTFAYYKMIVVGSSSVAPRAAAVFGVVLIGGTLALIGQIYNLEANIFRFLWLWTLLAAPFVFFFRTREVVFVQIWLFGSALVWSVFELMAISDIEMSTAVLLFTILFLGYSIFLYTLGRAVRMLPVWDASGRLLRLTGAGLAVVTLFVTTFQWYAEILLGYDFYSAGDSTTAAVGLSVVLNILFIGFLVFAMVTAMRREEYNFAFSIVRVFGVYLIVKYFTLFSEMLDTSIFLMLGGALFLIGATVLEKKKTDLMQYMKRTHNEMLTQ